MRVARARLVALVSLAAAIGCAGPTGPSEVEETLRENRSRFRALVGGSYVFDYRNLCFCPVFLVDGVRITLRDHAIVSVVALTDGRPEPPERWHFYKTVEGVFSAIEDALQQDAATLEVSYHERLGYPTHVFIDVDLLTADEEQTYILSNLEPEEAMP